MRLFVIACFVCSVITVSAQTTGSITFGHSDTVPSDIYTETQQINIYLPADYNPDSAATYPVIYVLDGALDEDFFHMAGLVQFSSFWWVNYLPPSIVVGIVSQERKRDMTYCAASSFTWPDWAPAFSEEVYRHSGQSDKFMQYIGQELIPYVEKNYKCSGKRTIIGQSLAGLFATEILLKKPTLFNDYIIMSPSLWWGNESLLKAAPQLLQSLPDTEVQIYIAVGKEGKVMEEDARKLAKIVQKAAKPATKVKFEYLPKEDHGTILHQAAGNAFEWMTE